MSNETTLACPHCDGSNIDRNGGEHTLPFGCKDCEQRFAEPVERDALQETSPRGGLAQELLEADPDEFGGKP